MSKRSRSLSSSLTPPPSAVDVFPPSEPSSSPSKAKKLKTLAEFSDSSPFPDYARPTYDEAHAVHELLSKEHPDIHTKPRAPKNAENTSAEEAARTCGRVKNVLDSLIGTVLSQNTSNANSSRALKSLYAKFGYLNFKAIAEAQQSEVVDAIRSGGMANKKSGTIQRILKDVKESQGEYSLQHLLNVTSDAEIMRTLVGFDGVGPKTAACVLLFCLGRASFAVDTHVYRLSRVLGWVPISADRVRTQAHLEQRIPPDLKYGLHVLMVSHGRRCKGCKDRGKGPCPLKSFVRERKATS